MFYVVDYMVWSAKVFLFFLRTSDLVRQLNGWQTTISGVAQENQNESIFLKNLLRFLSFTLIKIRFFGTRFFS